MKTFRLPLWCFASKIRKGEVTGHFCLEIFKCISGYKISKFCLGAVAAYCQTASIALLEVYLVYILEQFECPQYICWFTIRDTVCSRSGASVIISMKQRSCLASSLPVALEFPSAELYLVTAKGVGENQVFSWNYSRCYSIHFVLPFLSYSSISSTWK